jgi:hypothetical protein
LLASPAKKETRPCSEPRDRNEAAASAIQGGRLTCRRRPPVRGALELELLLGLRLRLPHGRVLGAGHRGGGGFGRCGRGRAMGRGMAAVCFFLHAAPCVVRRWPSRAQRSPRRSGRGEMAERSGIFFPILTFLLLF